MPRAQPATTADKGVPAQRDHHRRTAANARGYHTLHLGKWHLGDGKGMRPEEQGFDESLGFMIGAQMYLPENDPTWRIRSRISTRSTTSSGPTCRSASSIMAATRFRPDRYMTDYLTDQARRDDRRQPQPAVLPLPRLQRAAHAASGVEGRLRRAAADRRPPHARLCRDDPRARPRRRTSDGRR